MAGAFTHNGNVVEGLPSIASQINYSNTSSGLSGTTAQSAIDELASEKQDKSDNSLQTTDKTIPGAINEVRSGLTKIYHGTVTSDAVYGAISVPNATNSLVVLVGNASTAYHLDYNNQNVFILRDDNNQAVTNTSVEIMAMYI